MTLNQEAYRRAVSTGGLGWDLIHDSERAAMWIRLEAGNPVIGWKLAIDFDAPLHECVTGFFEISGVPKVQSLIEKNTIHGPHSKDQLEVHTILSYLWLKFDTYTRVRRHFDQSQCVVIEEIDGTSSVDYFPIVPGYRRMSPLIFNTWIAVSPTKSCLVQTNQLTLTWVPPKSMLTMFLRVAAPTFIRDTSNVVKETRGKNNSFWMDAQMEDALGMYDAILHMEAGCTKIPGRHRVCSKNINDLVGNVLLGEQCPQILGDQGSVVMQRVSSQESFFSNMFKNPCVTKDVVDCHAIVKSEDDLGESEREGKPGSLSARGAHMTRSSFYSRSTIALTRVSQHFGSDGDLSSERSECDSYASFAFESF